MVSTDFLTDAWRYVAIPNPNKKGGVIVVFATEGYTQDINMDQNSQNCLSSEYNMAISYFCFFCLMVPFDATELLVWNCPMIHEISAFLIPFWVILVHILASWNQVTKHLKTWCVYHNPSYPSFEIGESHISEALQANLAPVLVKTRQTEDSGSGGTAVKTLGVGGTIGDYTTDYFINHCKDAH